MDIDWNLLRIIGNWLEMCAFDDCQMRTGRSVQAVIWRPNCPFGSCNTNSYRWIYLIYMLFSIINVTLCSLRYINEHIRFCVRITITITYIRSAGDFLFAFCYGRLPGMPRRGHKKKTVSCPRKDCRHLRAPCAGFTMGRASAMVVAWHTQIIGALIGYFHRLDYCRGWFDRRHRANDPSTASRGSSSLILSARHCGRTYWTAKSLCVCQLAHCAPSNASAASMPTCSTTRTRTLIPLLVRLWMNQYLWHCKTRKSMHPC